jgi:uncharacterized protein YkwD
MLKSVPGCLLLTAYRLLAPDEFHATREAFLEQINAARAAVGARPLKLSAALSEVAQGRADEIAAGRDIPGPAGEEDSRRATRLGHEPRVISEVTAEADGDVEAVVGQWRQNGGVPAAEIAGGDYREMGLGVSFHKDVPLYVLVLSLSWEDYFRERTDALKDLGRMRGEMLALVNRERTRRGIAPLRRHPRLDEASQAHADDMFLRRYYSHDTPEGKTTLDRVQARGYRAKYSGENIAQGQYSVDEVMKGWMESPTHREHLLSPMFNDVGFGLAFGKNPGGYEILWVQNFGRTSGPARSAGQSKFPNF